MKTVIHVIKFCLDALKSFQILYPPHGFGDGNMPGMIDGDADRTE